MMTTNNKPKFISRGQAGHILLLILLALPLLFLSGDLFADEYWIYIETVNNYETYISENAQEGDIVEILPVAKFTPTEREKAGFCIFKTDLTKEEYKQYRLKSLEQPGPVTEPKIIASSRYKIKDLKELGLDTKGIKKYKDKDGKEHDKFDSTLIKSKIVEKTIVDVDKFKEEKAKYEKEKNP